jgi:hypothetical protein
MDEKVLKSKVMELMQSMVSMSGQEASVVYDLAIMHWQLNSGQQVDPDRLCKVLEDYNTVLAELHTVMVSLHDHCIEDCKGSGPKCKRCALSKFSPEAIEKYRQEQLRRN